MNHPNRDRQSHLNATLAGHGADFDNDLLRRMQEGVSKTNGVLGQAAAKGLIEAFEKLIDIRLPVEFRRFLQLANGCIIPGRIQIMGLDALTDQSSSLEGAVSLLRFGFGLDPDLLPIEDLRGGVWACLDCSRDNWGLVREFDVSRRANSARTYPSFIDYCWKRLNRPPDWEATAHRRLKEHIDEFQEKHGYSHRGEGKLPRNHVWRPYRFCIQDVVFGATAIRHSRELNCLEVDVFLTAEITDYDSLSGALALTRFILSEAWKCGGTMEIRFTNSVEGGRVPRELYKLAERYQIQLSGGRIKADESKALYAALTGFSAAALERLKFLEKTGRLSVSQACYLVHQNLWTVTQVEFLLGSELPEVSLRGLASPAQSLLWMYALKRARGAVMAGLFTRTLTKRSITANGDHVTELEDNVIPLRMLIIAEFDAIEITADEVLNLPWGIEGSIEIPSRQRVLVLIRPWSAEELPVIDFSIELKKREADLHALLVAKDFESLPSGARARCIKSAKSQGMVVLVAPESTESLDADSIPRMTRARILRK